MDSFHPGFNVRTVSRNKLEHCADTLAAVNGIMNVREQYVQLVRHAGSPRVLALQLRRLWAPLYWEWIHAGGALATLQSAGSMFSERCAMPASVQHVLNGLTAAGLPLFTGLLKRELRSGYC
jgi:hypothetical protein